MGLNPDAQERATIPPHDWQSWLTTLFASYVRAGFAPHHADFWTWVWSIKPGVRPDPFIAIWARGGGKTMSAELACAAIGARGIRPYVVYMRATQEQADRNIQTIAALLESRVFADYYPDMAARALGKYGNSKGWRRNRLRTAAGFTIDAMGLDTAMRGAKVEEDRPGLLILDDIDARHDTPEATQKKIEIITTSVLPAGSTDLAVLGIQNLIIPDGVFSQLADGRATFLANRIVSGPHKAVDDLQYEQQDGRYTITGGVPTWDGQGLDVCQGQIDDWGMPAFLAEAQQEVDRAEGDIFKRDWWRRYADLPKLTRIEQYVDSAFKDGVGNDYSVIATWGTDGVGNYYVVDVWRRRVEYPELIEAIHDQHIKHSGYGLQVGIIIEDKASGQSAIQTLRRPLPQLDGTIRPALPVVPFPMKGNVQQEQLARLSKVARAEGGTPLIQGGRVFLPERATWVDDFIAEHAKFPGGAHDDQCDTTSMALARLPRAGVRAY